MKPAMRQPVATCDITRYRYAARRAACPSWSVATSAAVTSVINSQAARNEMTSLAVNTSSIVPSSTLSPTPMKTDRCFRCDFRT